MSRMDVLPLGQQSLDGLTLEEVRREIWWLYGYLELIAQSCEHLRPLLQKVPAKAEIYGSALERERAEQIYYDCLDAYLTVARVAVWHLSHRCRHTLNRAIRSDPKYREWFGRRVDAVMKTNVELNRWRSQEEVLFYASRALTAVHGLHREMQRTIH